MRLAQPAQVGPAGPPELRLVAVVPYPNAVDEVLEPVDRLVGGARLALLALGHPVGLAVPVDEAGRL
eukprot:5846945-Prymnesium_polylepis.1